MRRLGVYLLDCLIVAVLVVGGYWLYQNHNQLLDRYYLRNYTPPTQVAALSSQATMTPVGQRLFYRANPQIDTTRSQLVQDCKITNDKTIELGCYLSTDKIYLLNIDEPNLKDEMTVTAGHEMLHAVYARMSKKEKKKLDPQLDQVAKTITDASFQARMKEYETSEPGEYYNELHSILGTEQAQLTPDLEAHYAKYFSNRAQIVSYSDQFNQAFDGLHTEITQLDSDIKAQKQTMQGYLAAGNVPKYNSLVPVINGQINVYNQKVELYNRYAGELLGQESSAGSQ